MVGFFEKFYNLDRKQEKRNSFEIFKNLQNYQLIEEKSTNFVSE